MNKIIFLMYAVTFLSCENNRDKNISPSSRSQEDSGMIKSGNIKTDVNLNAAGDTNKVFFNYSTMSFKVMYYRNVPQYILIDDRRLGQEKKMSNYQRGNKGLYISFNTDSNAVASFGTSYLNALGGVDVIMKQNEYGIKTLNIWKDPTNDGVRYDFSKINERKIVGYEFKDGNIIDSFVLHK